MQRRVWQVAFDADLPTYHLRGVGPEEMRYPEFGDFCDVAASGRHSRAGSSAAKRRPRDVRARCPRAGFGNVERYPTLLEKAAVLLERLARPPASGRQ
jgi:hypothetical protein